MSIMLFWQQLMRKFMMMLWQLLLPKLLLLHWQAQNVQKMQELFVVQLLGLLLRLPAGGNQESLAVQGVRILQVGVQGVSAGSHRLLHLWMSWTLCEVPH